MSGNEEPVAADWLNNSGEMGKVICSIDWSKTPLGSLESWSQSLRTTVSLCLASNFPINIIWGPGRVQIYNDGYWPICGDKHPYSMGQDFKECWLSAWDVIGEPLERAIAGETTFLENRRIFVDRNGYLEETFFTFSFSPIRDETGGVGGLFHPVIELTQQTLAERRLKVLRDLADRTTDAKTIEETCGSIAQALAAHHLDLPFTLLYQLDPSGKQADLASMTGLEPGSAACPTVVDLEASPELWALAEVARASAVDQRLSNQVRQVNDLEQRFGSLACSPYPESLNSAIVVPIALPGLAHPWGVFIAGVSPRRALDEAYQTFYTMLSESVTTAIANARAYEQERKRAEALAELDRAKTVFFSNVSHEFRTPLTLMLDPLNETLSRLDRQLPAIDREQLQMVQRNGQRLLKLVNTLLDFSRIEAGRMAAVYEPTDLAAFTAELASVFRSAIAQANLSFIVDCPPLAAPAWVDRQMWEKIVLNLLSNAFKFTFEGTIAVVLRERNHQIELEIRDTGIGISAAELPHIFERFHRVREAKGRSYEGSGIGLSLVQELVQFHGGTIGVSSVIARGTSFTVSIPTGYAHLPQDRIQATRTLTSTATGATTYVEEFLRWLPEEAGERVSLGAGEQIFPPAHLPTCPSACILLVDDNSDMRDYVRRLLSERGYEVKTATDGMAALAAVGQQSPDLVLADVMMPQLDGFGLLRELRANPNSREIPMILLSARAGESARIEGLEAGADDYLTKPFSARELLARVEATLKLAQLRREVNAAIQRSEERSRLAIRVAQLGTWRYDPKTNFVELDQRMREIWGEPENNMVLPLSQAIERIHPDDRARVASAINAALDPMSSGAYEIDYRVVWNDGTERWLFANGQAIFAGEGALRQAVELLGTALDISDRKIAEEAWRESEKQFRLFVTASSDMVYRMSADWSEMHNLEGKDFLASTENPSPTWLEQYIPQENQPQVLAAIQEAIRTKSTFELEHRVIRLDGMVGWTFSRAIPLLDAQNEIIEWLGAASDVTERKIAEEKLRQREAELKEAQRLGRFGNWHWDALTDATTGSDELLRIYGFDPAIDTMPNFADQDGWLYPHESWQRINASVQQTLSTGQGYELDVQAFRNGTPIWITTRSEVLRDSDGKIVGLRGTVQDITDRKIAEAALRDSEENFRTLADNMSQFAWTADANGWIYWYNRRWFEYTGTTLEEMQGWGWQQVHHPDRVERVVEHIRHCFATGEQWEDTFPLRGKDGTYRWFLSRAIPIRDEQGRILRWFGTNTDITDRQQVEAELRQKNAILDVVNESAPTPIFVKDRQGRMIYANPATLEVLGKSADEVIGYRDCDLYPNSEEAARVMENDRRIMESGQPQVVEESPDGIRTFLGMKAPYRNEAGEVIGVIGISNDISDRVQLERDRERLLQQEQAAREAAEQANRIKDEFLAVLSHELRSPLNPILGWTHLLQNGKLDATRQAEALKTIERNAKLQTQLIEDLLDISRIMRGKLSLTTAPVSLTLVITAAIETVRLAAEAKQISIALDLEEAIAPIWGDAARLQQVVWNLLSNAVKFIPNGGRVTVELRQKDRLAQIRVIDTGKGINPEFLPHVFEYFRQEDGSTTRKFGGLGLGLAIVRQIVEMHGGTVRAESQGENQGAIFTVQLPAQSQAIPAVSESPRAKAENTEAPLSNLQILVVDDENDTREFQAFVLEQSGAKVTAVASGLEALQVLDRFIPDVLVSDIGMAQMDGYMLIQQIRSRSPDRGGRIRAIALTAYAGEIDEKQALALGFQRHIAKPVEPEELVQAIATLLRNNE